MRRLTLSDFLTRARAGHGDEYDYSLVEYVNNATPVRIVCPAHGEFSQTPAKHLRGRGCPHPECVDARRRATCRARMGVDNPARSPEVRARMAATCEARYGVGNPMSSPEIRERLRESVREVYGVDCSFAVPDVRARIDETFAARYGGRSPMCSPEVRARRAETMLRVHGVEHALQSPEIRAKMAATSLVRYGATNPMGSETVRARVARTKAERGTFHTSSTEEELFGVLCDVFGEDDVVRQYRDERYPHACDFYVKSRDMFVELNAFWMHGGHWFDVASEADVVRAREWMRLDGPDSQYGAAVRTWAGLDVQKREDARRGGLNYVVMWDDGLRDAAVWVAMGCPDGRDWEREYSWLPDRGLVGTELPSLISDASTCVTLVARYYQFPVFYAREIALWERNGTYKNLPLRVFMYHNRLVHAGKTPAELSDLQLARGFKIAAVVRGYSTFDVALMRTVLDRYGFESVYDPCAGWGERMFLCYLNSVRYLGVDVNEALGPGYDAMRRDFGMSNQEVVFADAASFEPGEAFDAVVTCPPYGDVEIYSDAGAENLISDAFLAWWSAVVRNCVVTGISYFCFQINRRWRDVMTAVVEASGFDVVDELTYDRARSSHLTRRNGVDVKREFESMVVLRRRAG